MKKMGAALFAFIAFLPLIDLNAHSSCSSSSFFNTEPNGRPDRDRKVGDFRMIGRARGKSVALSNNIFYEPTNKAGRKKTKHWKIGDVIRLLRTKHECRFVLINLRNGNTVRTNVLNLD